MTIKNPGQLPEGAQQWGPSAPPPDNEKRLAERSLDMLMQLARTIERGRHPSPDVSPIATKR